MQQPPPTDWSEFYGPPAIDAPYHVGQTLIYQDGNNIENGTILYVAAQGPNDTPGLCYIVSPAIAAFPAPVLPRQIIAVL